MALTFVRIRARDYESFQERVAGLEKLATYPLGEDSFQIDHGCNYFAFFERMGSLNYFAALDGERIGGVGAGVLRRVPFRQGKRARRTWYLCDLKVHPEYQARGIPLRILRRGFFWNYLRCSRGYAISMNPGGGKPNRVVKLLGRWRWSPLTYAGKLLIYSLQADEMEQLSGLLTAERGPISYLSLQGIKDIVLQSTGQPMPLLHVQWGHTPAPIREPQPGHVHMFCSPEDDPLARALAERGLAPSASASLIGHRMGGCDWRFVLTSEI